MKMSDFGVFLLMLGMVLILVAPAGIACTLWGIQIGIWVAAAGLGIFLFITGRIMIEHS